MASSELEFFVAEWCAWPEALAEQLAFISCVPFLFWERNPDCIAEVLLGGQEVKRVTLEGAVGHRSFRVWKYASFLVICKEENPSTLVLTASLEVVANDVVCSFCRLSGEALDAVVFPSERFISSDRTLHMDDVTLAAYRLAFFENLVESVYQEVHVLLNGFQAVVPDGVVVWPPPGRSLELSAGTLGDALSALQQLSAFHLQTLDVCREPGFLRRFWPEIRRAAPSERLELWQHWEDSSFGSKG